MAVYLSPLAGAGWQFFTDDGVPLAGGKIFTYAAGTTTPQATYTTAAGNIAHLNPIILDANGRVNEVWLSDGVTYKFIIKDSTDAILGTYDDLSGINDVASLINGVYADFANTSNVAKGDALVGFKQANMSGVYAGAVGQTVHRKLQEQVSVFDFMTTAEIQDVQAGTNLIDVRAAVNNAFTAIIANGGGTLFFPKGTYYVSDYIGNTNYGGVTQTINLAVIGEPGTVINCNPSVYANDALYLRFQDAQILIVKNIRVECNTKVCTGIICTSVTPLRIGEVDSCQVFNVHAVNNPGVTTSVFGINVSSVAWGYVAKVTNCIVQNVTRTKTGLACQAIVVTGISAAVVENNSISNVRHSGVVGDKIDADGIVVFSQQNGSGNYEKSAAYVTNNHVRNCEGRFIKFQSNGSALAEGNYLGIDGSLELIDNWRAFDSQVGDATFNNNVVRVGDAWSGGASATMFNITPPLLANQDYTSEGFFQRVTNNNVEVQKNMSYFCIPSMPAAGVTANYYVDISNNICNYPVALNTTDQAANAFDYFIYLSSGPSVANTNGQVVWNIRGNIVSTYHFIGLTYTQADYTNKWFFYICDNWKTPTGYTREIFLNGANAPYTSTFLIRDNMIGQNAGNFTWPSDSTKWLNGCSFGNGDSSAGVISPAPANYRNGSFYKKGNIYGVEVVAGGVGYHYISMDNGANWYTT